MNWTEEEDRDLDYDAAFFGTHFDGPTTKALRARLDEADRSIKAKWLTADQFSPAFDSSFVYFIEAPSLGLIKIGQSTMPEMRCRGLSQSSPVPLYLLGFFAATPAVEQGLHRGFSDLRSHGEWFRDHADIRELMELVKEAELTDATPQSDRPAA